MNKEQLQIDNPNNQKSSLKYTLALAWLLVFSDAQADFTTNLILNPAYSALPWNILYHTTHSKNHNNLNKNLESKKTFNDSLNILTNYIPSDKKKIKQINRKYLTLFTKLYKDKNYLVLEFINDFINLSSEYGLNYNQSMDLFLNYYKNHFFPNIFSTKFTKEFQYRLWKYLKIYSKNEFEKRFKKIRELYSNWKLTKQNIYSIFPEIKNKEKNKEFIFLIFLLVLIPILKWLLP